MKNLFQCELFNQPFGDPVLYVRFADERRAVLFDLGALQTVSAGKLVKVDRVFVSHTHIDHFIGFDHLLRLHLGRDRTLVFYGPPGIIDNVQGKLRGYTWNLIEQYPFRLEVVEVRPRTLRTVVFSCRDRFRPGPRETAPRSAWLLRTPQYRVRAIALDHGVPSLAYCLEERCHINVNKDRVLRLGLQVGPWLRQLKDCIWGAYPATTMLAVPLATGGLRQVAVADLQRDLTTTTPGQKIVYAVDIAGTRRNMKLLTQFCTGASVLYCEAAFARQDADRALAKKHLTAAQAGEIARDAGVGDLRIIHFSPRYETCPELLRDEARRAWKAPC